ncbi:hypothetical protein MASR1M59_18960 [Melaminivora sp.]
MRLSGDKTAGDYGPPNLPFAPQSAHRAGLPNAPFSPCFSVDNFVGNLCVAPVSSAGVAVQILANPLVGYKFCFKSMSCIESMVLCEYFFQPAAASAGAARLWTTALTQPPAKPRQAYV